MHPYRMSSHNVQEFLEVFGRNGIRSKEVTWSDIRKALRERKPQVVATGDALLIENALNPESKFVAFWSGLMQFIAVYNFLLVPIRIAFQPWSSMVDPTSLAVDLFADVLVFSNVLVLGNIAYKNSRATWVTKRRKIFRKIKIGIIIAAIPLDW
jgi:hypothetical protein